MSLFCCDVAIDLTSHFTPPQPRQLSAETPPQTSCGQNNVERSYAIHESRLASVKASLSVGTPLRLDFVDKRLSKNFHLRRHHEQVVCDNLKLLRALEEIQSRTNSSTAACVGGPADSLGRGGGTPGGGKLSAGGGSSSTIPAVGVKKSLTVSATSAGKSHSGSMLNTMLERKRNAKAARVARENQQMLEVRVMTRIRSVYCEGIEPCYDTIGGTCSYIVRTYHLFFLGLVTRL